MEIFAYIVIGVIATYIGKIEKRVNVAAVSIPLAIPLSIFSALGAAIALIVIFKLVLLAVALIFFLISKLKFLLGAKIVGVFASLVAAFLGLAAGPIGWILLTLAGLVFLGALKDALVASFWALYEWFFRKFAALLLWVRRKSDGAREWLYPPFRFLVLFFEVPIVCASSVYSLWEIMDLADGNVRLTTGLGIARLVSLIPFIVYTYRAYIRDTTPPRDGGDGLELPLPLQATQLLPPS